MGGNLFISLSEHKARIQKTRKALRRRRLDALYLTNPTRILYVSGFSHIATERPLALTIPTDGPIFLMGPHLEYDHVRQDAPTIEEVYFYPDYPGTQHSMRYFSKIMVRKGLGSSRIATDSFSGASGGWGYRGPSLDELLPKAKFIDGRDIVDGMRLVKSPQELRLLRESAKWSGVAQDILMENLKPGVQDALVGLKASYETLAQMLRKLGSKYLQLKWGLSPVVIGFRGQVGPGSAIPHAIYTKRNVRRGDVLVSEAGVEIGGYTSELERTLIVGRPSSKAKRYFEVMVRAQAAALKTFRPGVQCGSVDEAARKEVEKSGLADCLRHHTGHGIGLDGHEPPWLDPGDRTALKTGMVFSCEPGLYLPGYAGFRHSDTVVITGGGIDIITEYPRDLESLTV